MTEREKREKAIEEMAIIARDTTCSYNCSECLCKCEYYDAAEMLYDAGYRKADEERKETAKAFANELLASLFDYMAISDIKNIVRDIMKNKFGVEVKE